jgi:heme/copper-type cytochrome/quinol oxidase subunit 3
MSGTAHHDEEIHMPEPSIWPMILAFSIPLLPTGLLLQAKQVPYGIAVSGVGAFLAMFAAVGWASRVIVEKYEIDIDWGNRVLSMAWKLFLASEAAIFGAFFGAYYYIAYHNMDKVWPPPGTPHIHLTIPAVGTLILMTSSLTCELAHKALIRGNKALAKNWLIATLGLGLFFVSMQGYEWGLLQTGENFTMQSNIVGTLFYLITGFHGTSTSSPA